MGDDQVRGEDDHDLLTFSESGIRLREEIAELEEALRDSSRSEQERSNLRARLSALSDALDRNTRSAVANPGEKGFLDYEPARPSGQDQNEHQHRGTGERS